MNLTEYNAMPEGDLKLAVRTAVTCGWGSYGSYNGGAGYTWCSVVDGRVLVGHRYGYGFLAKPFSPFTDTSIPCGLIGRGVQSVGLNLYSRFVATQEYVQRTNESKTHAILNAFCAADPSGHWAKFLKGE